jgi:hypothetical protein
MPVFQKASVTEISNFFNYFNQLQTNLKFPLMSYFFD